MSYQPTDIAVLQAEIAALKLRLAHAEQRAAVAEALAADRAQALDDLRQALNMISMSQPTPTAQETTPQDSLLARAEQRTAGTPHWIKHLANPK